MEPEGKDLLERLALPFPAGIVQWKPQSVNREKTRCLALAYVEVQPYQRRLDEVCPGWEDQYEITVIETPQPDKDRQGNAIVIPGKVFVRCRLTLPYYGEDGVPRGAISRMDVGECTLVDDNALTSAKAQAFKRACAAFGLGRYLYDLPKSWVDFDKDKYGISDNAIKQLNTALARLLDQKIGSSDLTTRKPPLPEAGVGPDQQSATAPATAQNGASASASNTNPAQRGSEASGAPQNGSQSGNGQPTGSQDGNSEIKACALHNVPMRKKSRPDGSSFWWHQMENGDYCDGSKVRPKRAQAAQ